MKNRLVMPPMVRNYADADGLATKRYVDHIARVAQGGVGTIILEASYVAQEGKGFMNQLGVHGDDVLPGLKSLAKAAHKHGAAIGIQLYHAGRQTSSKVSGRTVIAPSAIPDPTIGEAPEAMDQARIRATVEQYARAARRAKAAGLDFVEIHGAHGYLITQFLSPFSNRRTDGYGGSLENRMRFLLEVYRDVRAAVGDDFPVLLRLSGDEMVEGGLTIDETVKIARRMEKEGIDGLHISAGNYASYARGYMISPMAMPDAPLAHLAAAVKKAVKVPVIAVGKIRRPQTAERLLAEGAADFIAIGRTLLADPDWPEKVREGRLDEINPCIACNQGCIGRLFVQQDVWCTVNPETGREASFAKKRNGKKKKVIVVGGGPAGLSAAKVAASRGHAVVLFERTNRLGGQLFAAEAAPHREGWLELRQALTRDIKKLGVEVRLKTEFTVPTAAAEKPDAVIVAVGSSPIRPKIPGVGRTNVVVSRDVLEGRAKLKGKVVIVGGGCAGAQTAEFCVEKGHPTTIVEMTGSVAVDAPSDDRALLLGRLEKRGVAMLTETKVMSIGSSSVIIESHRGTNVLPADTVVLCMGSFPNDGFVEELRSVVPKIWRVGDAVEARRVTDAVAEGALAALAV